MRWILRALAALALMGGLAAAETKVSVGLEHTLYLAADGTVWAWGNNTRGQLGDGTNTQRLTGVQVMASAGVPLTGIIDIAAGLWHSLALKADGTVVAWGYNANGQLGDKSATNRLYPVQVKRLDDTTPPMIASIGAGAFHSIARDYYGRVYAWGKNEYGQLGNNDLAVTSRNYAATIFDVATTELIDAIAISAGYEHNLALRHDGTVVAWGNGASGRLGNNASANQARPVYVQKEDLTTLTGIKEIAAGGFHSLCLDTTGTIWAMGYNFHGQLGLGDNVSRDGAVSKSLAGVKHISAGYWHSTATLCYGQTRTWGMNDQGQLGNGTVTSSNTTVTPTAVIANAASIVSGSSSYTSAVLHGEGRLWLWGDNSFGQLGNGSAATPATPQLTYVETTAKWPMDGMMKVVGGLNYTLALRADGTVWSWGWNISGQLGNNTRTNSLVPVQVQTVGGNALTRITDIAAGDVHSLAMNVEGQVFAWGSNFDGESGRAGTTADVLVATRVNDDPSGTDLNNMIGIAAAGRHSLALEYDGNVYAWGRNSEGQLGSGGTANRDYAALSRTTALTLLTGVKRVAAGGGHSLALHADGTVRGSGRNLSGQLGIGTFANSSYFVPATSNNNQIFALDGGKDFSVFGREANSTPWATGLNAQGQLADGGTTNRATIGAVTYAGNTGSYIIDVVAGDTHGLALKGDRSVVAWGRNNSGQVGIGSSGTDQNQAVYVQASVGVNFGPAVSLGAGGTHSLAVMPDGRIMGWGLNSSGQVGDNSNTTRLYPVYSTTSWLPQIDASVVTHASEPSTGGTLRLSRSGGAVSRGALTVSYAVGGTATSGGDFSALAGVAIIPDGSASVDIPLTVLDDAVDEIDETVTLTVAADPAHYRVGSSASLTLADNDTRGVTITQSGGTTTPSEGGSSDSYTVVLTSQPTANVIISIAGTAGEVTLNPTSLSFTTSNWNVAQTVTVSAVNDSYDETAAQNTATLTHSASGGDYTALSIASVTCAVVDNDNAPTLAVGDAVVTEGHSGTVTVTVPFTITGLSESVVTCQYQSFNDNAVAGTDYTAVSGTLTWNPDDTASKNVVCTVAGDYLDEVNETFRVAITSTTSAGTTDGTGVVTITDDDTAGFSIVAVGGDVDTDEAGGTSDIRISLTSMPTGPVTLGVGSSDSTEGKASTASLLFDASNWSTSQTVTVTGQDDLVNDGDVGYSLLLSVDSSGDAQYFNLVPGSVALTNSDNDAPGIVCTPTSLAVSEGGVSGSYSVALATAPAAAVTVTLSSDTTYGVRVDADSGTAGDQTSIVFSTSNWNVARSVTVTAVDDSRHEGAHSDSITHTAASADADYNGLPTAVTATLTDNDPVPALGINSQSVSEGTGTNGSVLLTVTPTNARSTSFSVDFASSPLTALAGTDYTTTSGTLTWAANDAAAKTIAVTIVADAIDEANETLRVVLSTAVNCTIATSTGTITINDDDALPTVSLSVTGTPIAESGGAATLTATLNTLSGRDVTVNLASDGTATGGGTDFTASAASILIPAGSLSATGTITAVADALDEAAETVIIDVSSVTNGSENGTQQVTVTITDDDAPPNVTLAASPLTIAEAAGVSTVTATLSAVSGQAVTVQLGYGGTAAGADYAASASSLVIAAGSLSGTVTVTATQDVLDEAAETVVVDITGVTNGNESTAQQATITITDDDAAPTVTLAAAPTSIGEAGGTATLTATLSAVSGQTVTVSLGYTGAATSGSDYTSAASLVIAAGSASGSIVLTATDDVRDEADESAVIDITGVTNGTESGTQQVTVTIVDNDDPPTVAFTAATQSSVGESGTLTATVQLSAVSGRTVSVPFTATGTATGADYTVTASPLSIAAGSTTATVTITITADSLDEVAETVILTLGTPTFANLGAQTTHTATITDDDAAPTVTLSASPLAIAEAAGISTVTATLSAVSGQTVTVQLGYSGSAAGADYTAGASSIVIAPGATTGTTTVTAVQDALDEADETVLVDITAVTNGGESGTQQATVTITDDDAQPQISVATAAQTKPEGAGTATITLSLSAVSGRDVSVPFAVTGSATVVDDFTITATPVVIPAGSTTATVSVLIVNDAVVEATEDIIVTLGASPGNATRGAPFVHTLSVTDDEGAAISIADISVNEAAGTVTVTATLTSSGALGAAATATYTTASDSAVAGSDFTSATGTLTWPSGSTTGVTQTAVITVASDALDETDETFLVGLSAPSGVVISDDSAIVTILDDDAAPTVSLSLAGSPVAEAGGTATVTATLSAVSGRDVTVTLATSGTAISGTDFSISSTTIAIAAGGTTGTATITASSDVLDEANETVVVDITGVANGSENGTQQVTATITDDDAAPTVTLGASSGSMTETGGSVTLTATLSTLSGLPVTVNLGYGGSAGAGDSDRPASITIAADSLSGSVLLSATADALDEDDESVVIDITSASNATESGTQQATVLITDDDASPSVAFAVAAQSSAGESGTLTATISLSAASGRAVTVPYVITGSATGADRTVTASPASIAIGDTTAAVTITITGDAIAEAAETVILTLDAPTNATLGATVVHTATITDDDGLPSITLAAAPLTIAEAAGASTVTATASATSSSDIIVTLSPSGTADFGGDAVLSSGSITIPAGSLSATTTLTAVQDALSEGNETVILDIGSVSNGIESGAQQVTVTITDDDSVTVSVADAVVDEGSGTILVTATLSGASTSAVSVDARTVAGTAVAGSDYQTTSATLAWSAGESGAKTLAVTLLDDALDETDETFSVSLDTPVGSVTIADATALVTITDDDAPPTVTFTLVSQNAGEGDGTATLDVQLSSPSGLAVTVPYTVAGSATAAADFTIPAGPLSIPAGDTAATITIVLIDDGLVEGVEQIAVTITAGSLGNAGIGAIPEHTVSVADNDSASIQLQPASGITVTEGFNAALLAVRLSAEPTAPVTVTLASSDAGEADIHDTDAVTAGVQQTLTFTTANWSAWQFALVDGDNDDVADGDQLFTVTASGAGGGYDGTSASLAGTCTDNDAAAVLIAHVGPDTVVVEAGATDSYTIRLNSEPAAAVQVTVNANPQLRFNGATDAEPLAVWFAATDLGDGHDAANAEKWDQPVTVLVAAHDDDDDEAANHAATITHTVSSYAASAPSLTVSIADNDTAAAQVGAPSPGSLAEDGGTATCTIRLTTRPIATVVIACSSSDTGELTVSPATVTFTSDTWDLDQTITLSAVDDDLDDGNQTPQLVLAAAVSTDSAYNGVNPADQTVTVTDDDSVGFTVTGGPLAVNEGGSSATFTVRLTSEPTAAVTLPLSLSPTDAEHLAIDRAVLVFTTSDWDQPQTVTVTGADLDGLDNTVAATTTVVTGAPTSSDSLYGALAATAAADVTVMVSASNAPPVIGTIAADDPAVAGLGVLELDEDDAAAPVQITVGGLTAGQDEVQALSLSVASDNPALVTVSAPGAIAGGAASFTLSLVADASGSAVITVTLEDDDTIDGSSSTATATFSVLVAAANDKPVVDLDGIVSTSGFAAGDFSEGDPAASVVTSHALTVTDLDSTTAFSATATLAAAGALDAEESLDVSVASTPALTKSWNPATGVLSLVSSGGTSLDDFQAALRTLSYENTSGNPTEGVRSISVRVNDGAAQSDPDVATITVVAINDQPVLDLDGDEAGVDYAGTWNEGGGPVAAVGASTLALSDPDSPLLAGATAVLEVAHDGATESLSATAGGGITVAAYDSGTRTLTLSGAASASAYQAVLRTLTYGNTDRDPDPTSRQITVEVTDDDGAVASATTTLAVVAVNDPPELDLSGPAVAGLGYAATYAEGQAAQPIVAAAATLADPDNASLTNAVTVRIVNLIDSGDEILGMSAVGGLTPFYVAATGTLTLTGSGSVADHETALRSLTYRNASDNPNTTARTVEVTVDDGSGGSVIGTATVTLTAVNDPPVLDLNGPNAGIDMGGQAIYSEGALPQLVTVTGAQISDPDSPTLVSATIRLLNPLNGASEALAVNTDAATSYGITVTAYDTGTGVLLLSGSAGQAEYQQLIGSLTYVNGSDTPDDSADRSISLTLHDGTTAASPASFAAVRVMPQNDEPQLDVSGSTTLPLGGTLHLRLADGSGASATATIGAGAVTGIVPGAPGSGYAIAPVVRLVGGGGTGATATATVAAGAITGYSITNAGSGYTSAPTVQITSAYLVLGTSDADDALGTLTYTVPLRPNLGTLYNGGVVINNGDHFTVADLIAGGVSYVHNGLLAGADGFAVEVADASGGSEVAIITLTITGLVPPQLTVDDSTAVAWLENAAPVQLDAAAIVTDTDSANFGGGNITVTNPGGRAGDLLGFDPALVGNALVRSGSDLVLGSGGPVVGTLSGGSGSTSLVIGLTAACTPALAQTIVRGLTWTNTGENPAADPEAVEDRTLTVTLNDGVLGSNSQDRTIAVDPVDDPPYLQAQVVALTPGLTVPGQLVAIDPEGEAVTCGPPAPAAGAGAVVLAADGAFTYQHQTVGQLTDTFNVVLTEAGIGGQTAVATVQVQVTAPEAAAPRITSSAPVRITAGTLFTYLPVLDGFGADREYVLIPALQEAVSGNAVGFAYTFSSGTTGTGATGTLRIPNPTAPPGGYLRTGILVIDRATGRAAYQPILIKIAAEHSG